MAQADRARLQQAIALHQQGNLPLAEILYRGWLAEHPQDAQALGLLDLHLGLCQANLKGSGGGQDGPLQQASLERSGFVDVDHGLSLGARPPTFLCGPGRA